MKYLLKIFENNEIESDLRVFLSHLSDDGFEISFEESEEGSIFIRIWKPVNKTDRSYSYENSANFDWSLIEDEVRRAISMSNDKHQLQIKFIYTIENSFTGSGYERTFWKKTDLDKGLDVGGIKCFAMSVVI